MHFVCFETFEHLGFMRVALYLIGWMTFCNVCDAALLWNNCYWKLKLAWYYGIAYTWVQLHFEHGAYVLTTETHLSTTTKSFAIIHAIGPPTITPINQIGSKKEALCFKNEVEYEHGAYILIFLVSIWKAAACNRTSHCFWPYLRVLVFLLW